MIAAAPAAIAAAIIQRAASFTITHSVECDTGVLGEIRYFK
jgi:hypothetical protein